MQRVLLCSGQTSVDAVGVAMHDGDMAAQVNQVLDNLETVLREAGFQISDVVRLNYYTTDVEAFITTSAVLGKRLGEAGCRPRGRRRWNPRPGQRRWD